MPRPTLHDIYRNLNKAKKDPTRHVWSIRTGGLVQGHSTDAVLIDAVCKVNEEGRKRIVQSRDCSRPKAECGCSRSHGRRAVCAFIRGTLATRAPSGSRVRISFNPYKSPTFYRCDTGAPVTSADAVIFTRTGCYAVSPR
jgi:hypothetical protein